MSRLAPRVSLGQAVQVAQLLSWLSNINWKGFKPVIEKIKGLWGTLDLKEYWGRLLLIAAAALLIGFVLFDWRSQAVQKVEARAALATVMAERDTLALKIAGDAAAATERQRILLALAETNRVDMEALNDTLENNGTWANQPLPPELRQRLR